MAKIRNKNEKRGLTGGTNEDSTRPRTGRILEFTTNTSSVRWCRGQKNDEVRSRCTDIGVGSCSIRGIQRRIGHITEERKTHEIGKNASFC